MYPETVADWIGIALVIVVLALVAYHSLIAYAESLPIYDPMQDGPEDQQEIAARHVDKMAINADKDQQAAMLKETLQASKLDWPYGSSKDLPRGWHDGELLPKPTRPAPPMPPVKPCKDAD